jgi:exodeoxyribonuclease-3
LSAQQKSLKVITYNIFEGMTLDTTANKDLFVDWVKQQDPDILALQEVNKFTQLTLETMARRYNHPYAVLLKEKGFPVALTSKYPIVNVQKVIDNMHHGFIRADIAGYNVIVAHLSPHKYWKRHEEIEVILKTAVTQSNKNKTIIMGDFNAISESDADYYANGKILQKYVDMGMKYAYHDNLIDGKLDFGVHKKIVNQGYIDVFKQKNPKYDFTRPTVKTADEGRNASSRIDFIYVSKKMKSAVLESSIIRDAFTNYYSDHYPVMMVLKK